jgi:succinoglycan biosynthesis transport protein ExoP
LSRSRLQELIDKFNLYPELKDRATPEAVIERMRKDIRLERKEVGQQGGQRGVTIGFNLSYQGWDPETVATVTNTLASYYAQENQKIRQSQAAATSALLKERLEEVKKRLSETVPPMSRAPDSNITTYSVPDPAMDRAARARQETMDRLVKLRQELAEMRVSYGDKYPDVIRLQAEIDGLENRLLRAERASPREEKPAPPSTATTPVPAEPLQGNINAFRRDQDSQRMTRDYTALREIHASLLRRYEDALLAENLERQKGEHFRILDAALVPSEPVAPGRQRLMLMGLVLAIASGIAAMFAAERLDTSFRRMDELRDFANLPILASIPRIVTPADIWRARLRFGVVSVLFTFALILVVRGSYALGQAGEQLVWTFAQRVTGA